MCKHFIHDMMNVFQLDSYNTYAYLKVTWREKDNLEHKYKSKGTAGSDRGERRDQSALPKTNVQWGHVGKQLQPCTRIGQGWGRSSTAQRSPRAGEVPARIPQQSRAQPGCVMRAACACEFHERWRRSVAGHAESKTISKQNWPGSKKVKTTEKTTKKAGASRHGSTSL